MQIVRNLPRDKWSRFVDGHPKGNVFHTPEMFDVFQSARGCSPELWAVIEEGPRILALMIPVRIVWVSHLLSPVTTQTVVYGGVLHVDDREGEQGLRRLLQGYCENVNWTRSYTEIRNLHEQGSALPILEASGFEYEEHLNFLINIGRAPAEIMQDIGSRTRKNIRRALRRENVKTLVATQWKEAQECYGIVERSYKAANVPVIDISLFRAAFEMLYPRRMIRFSMAQVEDRIVASSIDLVYKDVIYGWYGGVDRDYSSYMPNEVLTWRILEWGSESGYHLYDFGGAGKPDEEYGVRDFKAKFGGELVCYGRNTCIHAPMRLRLSKVVYELLRGLVRLSPQSRTRKVIQRDRGCRKANPRSE